jgi:UDP-glucose 4-epimerase
MMKRKNTWPTQVFLTRLYTTPILSRPAFRCLNAIFFLIEKIPFIRDHIPLTSPKKNNITYLPINKTIQLKSSRVLPVDKTLPGPVSQRLPHHVLDQFIDRAACHVIMTQCICRTAFRCRHFPHDIGCLFMGATALKLPPGLGTPASRAQAKQHVQRAIDHGLVPMVGKVNVDNLGFLTPDTGRLLSVCFCCHCCCMMGYYKHSPAHLQKLFKPVESLSVIITDNCTGCGVCREFCIFDAIRIENGKAAHADHCVGCGRCQTACPNNAVHISVGDPDFHDAVTRRIGSFVDIS